jgi:hypothetical protein
MLLNRFPLIIILGLMTIGCASAQTITCPVALDGHKLSSIDMYDGPPSDETSLSPDNGGWQLGYPSLSKKGFFIICGYANFAADQHPKQLSFHVHSNVKACLFQDDHTVLCQ